MRDDFFLRDRYGIDDLLQIMAILRGEGGCPWDREQNHLTIRNNFIEETYEVVEAIDNEDLALLQEELGDVLLQVVFHTRMEEEAGTFSFEDVCDGICKKLILRHPHIFGDTVAATAQEVLTNWDAIKRREKRQETTVSAMEGVSRALPSLIRSEKVQKKAAKAGFDYADVWGALEDLRREISELEEALGKGFRGHVEEEIGDVLFSAVNVSRMVKIDAEEALYRSTDKFIRRFAQAEEIAAEGNIDFHHSTPEELDNIWKRAKENSYKK